MSQFRAVAIIQARMGSSRLPGKTLMPLGDGTVLTFMLRRVLRAKTLDAVVVATSDDKKDNAIMEAVFGMALARTERAVQSYEAWQCEDGQTRRAARETRIELRPSLHAWRGSESDVLARFYDAARTALADVVVRLTADCALADPEVIDAVVEDYLRGGADYVSNAHPTRTMLKGFDVEVFSMEALRATHFGCRTLDDAREHVTPHMYYAMRARCYDIAQRPFVAIAREGVAFPTPNLSIDTADDLARVREVVAGLGPDCNYANVVGFAAEKGWLTP